MLKPVSRANVSKRAKKKGGGFRKENRIYSGRDLTNSTCIL